MRACAICRSSGSQIATIFCLQPSSPCISLRPWPPAPTKATLIREFACVVAAVGLILPSSVLGSVFGASVLVLPNSTFGLPSAPSAGKANKATPARVEPCKNRLREGEESRDDALSWFMFSPYEVAGRGYRL